MATDGKSKRKSVIFPDTVFPNSVEAKILSYVRGCDLPKKPIAFYVERAEHTLRSGGLAFDQPSFDRWTDKRDRSNPEINEAWRIKSLSENLKTIRDLVSRILGEAAEALRARTVPHSPSSEPPDGFENILGLMDQMNEIAAEIGALGERIKGRESDPAAFEGSGRMRRYKKARVKIDRTRREIRNKFLRLYWAERKRSQGTERKRPQMFKTAKAQFEEKYPNLKPPSDSAAYSWTSGNRKVVRRTLTQK